MNEYVIQVSSGTGPAEARRFVVRLADKLERLCDRHGLSVSDVAFHGDEAEPRSVVLRVRGDVPRCLGAEEGSHALIHRSPKRGSRARKRWFASVTIFEAIDCEATDAEVNRSDLVITACRAGGPGGQHVNKVASAVRVEHVPSGICVRVASERSQQANIGQAIRRIAALLRERTQRTRAAEGEARRALHYRVVRGNAIRTYDLNENGALAEEAAK